MNPIIPCIFGTTRGFEIHTLTSVPLNVIDLTFKIGDQEVVLADRNQCLKILRLSIESRIFTWIGLYKKAYEIGYAREGGYYGAGVWLADIAVDAGLVLKVLEDLVAQINVLAIADGVFHRELSGIIDEMHIPPMLVRLNESRKSYQGAGLLAEAKSIAYICETRSNLDIVEWAQNGAGAEKFHSVVIAPASSFPRSASSRLKRFDDFTNVVREFARDLSEKIAGLEKVNSTLKKENTELQRFLEDQRNKARDNLEQEVREKERMHALALQFSRDNTELLKEKSNLEKNLSLYRQSYSGTGDGGWTWKDKIFAVVIFLFLEFVVVALVWGSIRGFKYIFPQEPADRASESQRMTTYPWNPYE